MTPSDPDALNDRFADQLADYDEALADGRLPTDTLEEGPLEERLRKAQQLVRLLAQLRPRTDAGGDPLHGMPRQVGRFRVEAELGRGGCGIVYLAHDPLVGRKVALKVPRLETLARPEIRGRFLREAQAAGALSHPHIVPLLEAGELGTACYIVSAYCHGPNLAGWLKQQPGLPDADAAARLIVPLAEAIDHAHARGIIHRDLKPSNILIDADGSPRITDFGLAKLLDADPAETPTGMLLGTPAYMAPEQALGRLRDLGPPCDVYSLGAVLYELLTGRPPFVGQSVLETLDQVRAQEPAAPGQVRPGVPRDLETICLKCLAKEPAQRYASGRGLADDLNRYLRREPIQARPATLWTQLRAWSRRPERIPQAGHITIGWGVVMATYCVFLLGMILAGQLPFASNPVAVSYGCIMLFGYYLPGIYVGLSILHGRPWAIRTGALAPLTLLIWWIANKFTNFDKVYISGPDAGNNVYFPNAMSFGLLTLMLAANWAAWHAHRAARA